MLLAIALLIVAPIVELYVMVQVAGVIGALPTVLLVIAISLVGAWLTKVEGLAVLRRARTTLEAGELPANESIDGLIVAGGGVLMMVPGFISGIIGLILLLPPVRALLRRRLRHRIERGRTRLVVYSNGFDPTGFGGPVVDASSQERPDVPPR